MSCMNYARRLSKNENKGPLGEKEYFENSEEEKRKIIELIEKIKTSEYIVVHVGAGISTSSGLQDFRGPTGIWTNEFLAERQNKKKRKLEKKQMMEIEEVVEKEAMEVKEDKEAKKNNNDNNNNNYNSQSIKTKKIRKSSHGRYEHSDDLTKRSSTNQTEELPFDFIKTVRPEGSYQGDNIVKVHTGGAKEYSGYHTKDTKVEVEPYCNNTDFIPKTSFNNCNKEVYEHSDNDSKDENDHNSNKAQRSDNDFGIDKIKNEYFDTIHSYGRRRKNEQERKNNHVRIKNENPTVNFDEESLWIDDKINSRKNELDDGESSEVTKQGMSEENYVIFGNRKKKVVDLHLALPTKTHIMIKELMNKNIIKFLITQNIDSLHYRCGTKFSKISEIHGNIFVERCDFCGRRYLRDYVISTISFKPTGSLCFLCSFPPIGICTDVLLDWNNAYEDFFHLNSIKHSQMADFHFCLGSSFYIVPASYYPSKKKFANEKSYSCLINYQKSSLSKEVNLSLHSNVNNISDIIIKEFSLEPLSIRTALILVVRCQILDFDLLFDNPITVNNMSTNSYYLQLDKDEGATDSSCKNTPKDQYHSNNGENYFHKEVIPNEEKCYTTSKKKSDPQENRNIFTYSNLTHNDVVVGEKNTNSNVDNFSTDWKNEGKNKNTYKEQLFLIKCSMIKNISTDEPLHEIHKLSVIMIDKKKGIWLIRTNFPCILEIELWYNSFVLLKLNYNEHCPFVELNAWNVDVAYTYGDDIDDVDYLNNYFPNCKNFNLQKNKYVDNNYSQIHLIENDSHIKEEMQSMNNQTFYTFSNSYNDYDKTVLEQSLHISEILHEHVHVGYNPNNFNPKSKVEQLAILTNANKFSRQRNYVRFELPHSMKFLYNIFCLINKPEKEKVKNEQVTFNDKIDTLIKNLHLPKNINLYTSNFINSFIQKERMVYQNHYTFRERKKKKLNDFNLCLSSDENKEKQTFIFYDLYMHENKDMYKIKIKKDLIQKKIFGYSILSNYTEKGDIQSYISNSPTKNNRTERNKSNENDSVRFIETGIENIDDKNYLTNSYVNNRKFYDTHEKLYNYNIHSDQISRNVENESKLNNSPKNNQENCPMEKTVMDYNVNENALISNSLNTNDSKLKVSKSDKEWDDEVMEEGNYPSIAKKKPEFYDQQNSELLFNPNILINSKYKLGELVSKIPKYIKPQKIYTPYRKLSRDKKNSNTLQKCRSEIWEEKYTEFICDMKHEHVLDSALFREVCYFPLWLLSYVNDLFECL
ncbi:hypothetical protein, conserved [Plasmodium gonderi]|uniref:protein acetyllysine N-acetyltransferase n=1 Tax=Plasmodium gonderi TaxID=77519 RepID=A0A1Y1JQ53_PLAGO|nr:hypothetical protein, conserved [Plasmodium gonderi]GAW82573.1 hypothetical protein, conserved [Plasmodium gonderi]